MPTKHEHPTEFAVAEIAYGTNVRELDDNTPGFKELVESVKTHGVLEPLLVRPTPPGPQDHAYELVAGYRRIAAAKAAGLKVVPIRVLDLNDTERAEVQLLENLLRENLTPMEEARGIHAYSEAAAVKPKEIAARIHKSESYVRDRLRLLNLIPEGQAMLEKGTMDVGHAVVVATLPAEGQKQFLGEQGEYDDGEMRGPVDEYFRTGVRQMTTALKERDELRAKAKDAKFPVCPKKDCGQLPERTAWAADGASKGVAVVQDAAGHIWNLQSGEVKARASVIDASPTIAQERAERKTERFDRSVCPMVLLKTRPHEIVTELIKSAADGVSEVKLRYDGDTLRLEVEFGDERPEVLDRKLNWAFGATFFPAVTKEGHVTAAVAKAPSGKDRKETLKVLRELAPVLPDPVPMETPPPQLEGTVSEVAQKLGGYTLSKDGKGRSYGRKKKGEDDFRENRPFLQLLRVTEAAGKNRGSVLDAIDLMLGADTPAAHGSDY